MRIPFLAWPATTLWAVLLGFGPTEKYAVAQPPEWVIGIREQFSASLARFGGDGAALLPGLVLGDTTAVPETLTRAMRVSSLAHLTAVSGANCAVIVSVIFGLAALCGLGIWWRVGIAVVGLAGFVVLVGAEPSVIRASIMAVLALWAIAVGRTVTGLSVLSGAVFLSLVVSPTLARSIGFALSVVATLGLLLLTRPLHEILSRWISPRIAMVVAVPIAAQVSVQPLLLLFQPSIPTYGVIANTVADPLAPIATIAGLFSLVSASVPPLSIPLAGIAWCASTVIAWIARTAASLPFASIPWPAGQVGIVLATACTGVFASALLLRRRRVAVVGGVLVAISLSTTIGGGVVAWATAPRDWVVAQCDVGQGDALVLRDSGEVAVIDTGRDEFAFRECLRSLGVSHISLLVLTHFDIDHAGAYAVGLGMVDTVLHGPPDGFADETTVREFANSGATAFTASRGMNGHLGRWRWRVLWPTPTFTVEPGNPASVVMQFQAQGSELPSVLDLGDLPAREQEMMTGLGGVAHVDIVKVSHHGSRDQFVGLYERLRASVALIGVGADNEYGHPTDETLAMLQSLGSTAVRTDRQGIALVATATDGVLRVWTERAG
ncbi:MAG: ComEC/Rec2 family competence protein [Microbacteriaceae bacterium]